MSDHVKRLREMASSPNHHRDDHRTWREAADRIEELERDKERLDWLEGEANLVARIVHRFRALSSIRPYAAKSKQRHGE